MENDNPILLSDSIYTEGDDTTSTVIDFSSSHTVPPEIVIEHSEEQPEVVNGKATGALDINPVAGPINSVFEYTGDYEYVEYATGKYYAKLLTNGTFKSKVDSSIDVFVVGGGGGPSIAGGGGGYTTTYRNYPVTVNGTVAVVIGAGGVGHALLNDMVPAVPAVPESAHGESSYFGSISAGGGKAPPVAVFRKFIKNSYYYSQDGGPGGSGGGSIWPEASSDGGWHYRGTDGGTDGARGWHIVDTGTGAVHVYGGAGQDTCTHAFGGDIYPFNTDEFLFAGGGQSMTSGTEAEVTAWLNGSYNGYSKGGGGAGAVAVFSASGIQQYALPAADGKPNTGGGAGSGGKDVIANSWWADPTVGGSGVVIIRGSSTPPNSPPTTPGSIGHPASITANTTITVSWGAATDPDNNLSGYKLECNRNGVGYSQIYQGSALSTSYTVPLGTTTLQFRVKAYDDKGLESSYATGSSKAVTKASQSTLTLTNPGAKTWGNAAFALSASEGSGTGSLSYNIVSGADVIGISGGNVTIKKVGSASVTVTKAADTNYAAITSAPITITVSPRNISNASVTITSSHTYTGAAQTPSFNLTDSVAITTSDRTVSCSNNTNAGAATLTLTGTGNYTGTKTQTFAINKKSLTVSADAKTTVYGSTSPVFTTSFSGFVAGQTASVLSGNPSYSCPYSAGNAVGNYTITPSIGSLSSTNYSFTFTNGTLSVTRKPVTIQGLTVNSKVYDGSSYMTINSGNSSVSGNIDGSSLGIDVSSAVAMANSAKVGTRTVTFSGVNLTGVAAPNYTLTAQPSPVEVTITKRQLQAAEPVVELYKVYDGSKVANAEPGDLLNVIPTDTVFAIVELAEYNAPNTRSANQIKVEYALSGVDAFNYIEPVAQVFSGKIIKDEPNVTWPVLQPLVYGDSLATLDLSSGSGDGYFTWSIPGYKPTVSESGTKIQLTFYPNDDENYLSLTKMLEVIVLPKKLHINGVVAVDKVYDGLDTIQLDLSGLSVEGNIDSENLKLNTNSCKGLLPDATVGSNRPVALTGLSLSGTASSNYVVVYPTNLKVSVTPLQLQITEPQLEPEKEYDGTTMALVTPGDLTNKISGDDVAVSAEANYNNKNLTEATHITVEYTLSGTDADNYQVPAGLEVPLEK